MNRLKRILSRGWLGTALNALTFGYYPRGYIDVGPVDWCIGDAALHTWTATTASAHAWTASADILHSWTLTDETVECD